MSDMFDDHTAGLESPASHAFTILPSDIENLERTTRAIYTGTTGNLTVTMLSGDNVTFPNVPAGTILPVRSTRVLATGTTANQLVGMA